MRVKDNHMSDTLFPRDKEGYGDDYQRHLLEQYKLYIAGIEKISDRRQSANNYFITINTAILAVLLLSLRIGLPEGSSYVPVFLALPIAGIAICVIFYYLIRSYRQMNTGKFIVVHAIEQQLPMAPYDYEWKILKEGKDRRVYFPFSRVEQGIPFVFGVLYLFLFLFQLFMIL